MIGRMLFDLRFGLIVTVASTLALLLPESRQCTASSPEPPGVLALTTAARQGDLQKVQTLLASGVNPGLPDRYGLAPLHYAVSFNEDKIVALLLAKGADPNEQVADMATHGRSLSMPLQYAADRGNLQIASMLVAAGAQLNAKGSMGRTALQLAAYRGHLDMLRFLLQKGADPSLRDADGSSPLDEAVWGGSVDSVALLLAHGALLNGRETVTGATPLNEAAFLGETSVTRYLLQQQADLSIPDKRGYRPLQNALRMRRSASALLLLQAEFLQHRPPAFYSSIMQQAVRGSQTAIVEALLEHGLKPNDRLPSGSTALGEAASSGSADLVSLLLNKGADPNITTLSGVSALEDASLKGFTPVCALLLQHGALVDYVDPASGTTALYAAASFGKNDVVKLLLDHGADPNLCSRSGKSPYQSASENSYSEIAREIERHGGRKSCRARSD